MDHQAKLPDAAACPQRGGRFLIFLLLLAPPLACAAQLTGRVVGVVDGDIITVLDAGKKERKVRIAGIDAPEPAQPFGNRSKQHLSYLVYDKTVDVEYKKYDRYGRIVGKVMVAPSGSCLDVQHDCPKALDAGLAQIVAGLAWHYKEYQRDQSPEDREKYAAAEAGARKKRQGLWRSAKPVPPWEFRQDKRRSAQ